MSEELYMRRAIELAGRGAGWTRPNPLVGAVIVKDGRVIGEGWHERLGEPHAERNALKNCTADPRGATIYVTLEPCCHTGRTGPCTEAIIASGISRVVIGSRDPNPLVAGQGAEILRRHGIQVESDFLRAECDRLNPIFFHYITTSMPFVALKYAMTADGKLASATGASQWITGETARRHVHELRRRYAAIMVGIGTVLADDPLLTCRIENGRDPLRIVCDSHLRLPLDSQLVRTARDTATLVATLSDDAAKMAALTAAGLEVLRLPAEQGMIDLQALFAELAAREIDSVLVEGGSELAFSLLDRGLAQRLYCYMAPKILGGAAAKSPVGGRGWADPNHCLGLAGPELRQLGDDLLLTYDVKGVL